MEKWPYFHHDSSDLDNASARAVSRVASQLERLSQLVYKHEFFRQMENDDREPRLIPFVMYLGDEQVMESEAEKIDVTLTELIRQTYRCHVVEEYQPISGSWWRMKWFRTMVSLSKGDFDKLVKTAQEGFALQAVERQEAEQTQIYANALQQVSELFKNEGDVNCLIGNMLYIKTETNGQPKTSVITISDKNIKFLMNNPGILRRDQDTILKQLESQNAKPSGIAKG